MLFQPRLPKYRNAYRRLTQQQIKATVLMVAAGIGFIMLAPVSAVPFVIGLLPVVLFVNCFFEIKKFILWRRDQFERRDS
jgi:hypothetical protein